MEACEINTGYYREYKHNGIPQIKKRQYTISMETLIGVWMNYETKNHSKNKWKNEHNMNKTLERKVWHK